MKRKTVVNLINTRDITKMKKIIDNQSYFQVNYKIIHQNKINQVFTFLIGNESDIQLKAQNHIKELNTRAKKGYCFELIDVLKYQKS